MNYKKKAFTLIELIVWIAIIAIITLWITKLYWSNIPDKQKLDLFTNKIIWIIDSVKNYSLVWKWIWNDLETPKYFRIELSTWVLSAGTFTWSYLKTYYNTWSSDVLYDEMTIKTFNEFYNIRSLKCQKLDLSGDEYISKISVIFKWSSASFSWCSDNYHKIVDINLWYKWFNKIIRLNALNWVVEEIKK